MSDSDASESVAAPTPEAAELRRQAIELPGFSFQLGLCLKLLMRNAVRAAYPRFSALWPLLREIHAEAYLLPQSFVAVVLRDTTGFENLGKTAQILKDAPKLAMETPGLAEWHGFFRRRFEVADDGAVFLVPLRIVASDFQAIVAGWGPQDRRFIEAQLELNFARHRLFLQLEEPEPVREDKAGIPLTDTEATIVKVIGDGQLFGREIAKKTGYPLDSHVRQVLSNLAKRGILKNDPGKGYRVMTRPGMS